MKRAEEDKTNCFLSQLFINLCLKGERHASFFFNNLKLPNGRYMAIKPRRWLLLPRHLRKPQQHSSTSATALVTIRPSLGTQPQQRSIASHKPERPCQYKWLNTEATSPNPAANAHNGQGHVYGCSYRLHQPKYL